jgi:photosystem II stability/assembly factor-like uncharacterized protein
MRLVVPILIIVVLLAVAPAGGASAGSGAWTKVYDVPGRDFGAVEMFDDARGIATAAGGLFYTTDGGTSWQEGAADEMVALGGVWSQAAYISFGDADHAWVAGFNGQMWRTADGGRTWRKQTTNTLAHFNSVSAVSADEAWAAAFGEGFSDIVSGLVQASVLLHTADGGATWQPAIRASAYGVFHQVDFADQQRGWLMVTPCFPGQRTQDCAPFGQSFAGTKLLRTEDGGRTWDERPLPVPASRPERMQWFAGGRGYLQAADCSAGPIASCVERLYRTTDGGDRWNALATPAPEGFSAWRFVSAERGYTWTSGCKAGDCSGTVWETSDGGGAWRALSGGRPGFGPMFDATSTRLLTPVLDGDAEGIALVDLATGTRTAAVVPGHAPFSDVAFGSAERGYALSRDGLWVSDDGGAHWRLGPTPLPVSRVSAPSRDVVWILASDPACPERCAAVYRSGDGGRTWIGSAQRFASSQSFDAADAQTAWVSADSGLWRTTDGGGSWRLLNDESGPWEFIDRSFGVAVTCKRTCDGEFLVTGDGGVTVERRAAPAGARFASLFFLTTKVGWATGQLQDERGGCRPCQTVFRTTDGAAPWEEMWRSGTESIERPLFIDRLHGWGVQGRVAADGSSAGGAIVSTTDAGRTWSRELPDVTGRLLARDGTVWAVAGQPIFGGGLFGLRTTIWRRGDAGRGIVLPPSGSGVGAGRGRDYAALAALLGLAGALLWAAGRPDVGGSAIRARAVRRGRRRGPGRTGGRCRCSSRARSTSP